MFATPAVVVTNVPRWVLAKSDDIVFTVSQLLTLTAFWLVKFLRALVQRSARGADVGHSPIDDPVHHHATKAEIVKIHTVGVHVGTVRKPPKASLDAFYINCSFVPIDPAEKHG